jgi:uncharacterized Tic20 family protein
MATNLPQLAALPTEDEKNLAMLNYILSIFGWLAPLIIWLVKRESKFVAFHALQTLFWHGIYTALAIIAGILFFLSIFITAAAKQQGDGPGAVAGTAIVLLMLLIWGGGLTNLVFAIVFAIKAKHGEWTRLPIVGKWARRATGLATE